MEEKPVLVAEGLVKQYGPLRAVDGVDLRLYAGEVLGLLGPNGAGKTTVLKCLTGLARLTAGRVEIDGRPHTDRAVRLMSAFVPEVPTVYGLLTPWEHLRFVALAYRLGQWEEQAEALLRRFDLWKKRNSLASTLSKGMRQKVLISAALLHRPRMLYFDEPLGGLDPQAQRELKEILADLAAQGHAVLISTHMLDTAERLCGRAVMLKRGRVIAEGGLGDLRARFRLPADVPLEDVFLEAMGADGP